MKRKKQQGKSLKFVIVFCFFVLCLVAASIVIKTLLLIRDSSFDGQHRFNLAVYQDKQASIVSFSPETHSIAILNLKGKVVSNNLGQYLELPVNATLKTNNMIIDKNSIASDMSKFFYHYNGQETSLTIIDALRLWLFSKNIPVDFISQRDVLSDDTFTINSFASSSFIDSTISNEKTTIGIVNATSTYGLANRLAVLITNMGGDVVLISSSDTVQSNSQILYSGDLDYTINKLSSILGIKPIKTSKKGIGDVTIVLGTDVLSRLKF